MIKTDLLKRFVFIILILLVITAGAYLIVLVIENEGVPSAHTFDKTKSSAESQTQDTQKETTPTETSEVPSESSIIVEEDINEETEDDEDEEETIDEQIPPGDKCLADYNITKQTIIFYYQDGPYSNAMLSIVQELESNYNFYKTTELWNNQFNSCFGLSGATPAFICAGTNQKIIGEVSKETLTAFASNCS